MYRPTEKEMKYDNPLIKRDNKKKNAALIRASVISMLLNLCLAAAKVACGVIFGAISVVADGFNNLSDCGGNVITVFGIKMAARPADSEHPFGHARGEYVAALSASFMILLLAAELLFESVDKIISGFGTQFSLVAIIALAVGIVVKTAMFFYNRYIGKRFDSETARATAIDSISDAVASAAVMTSLIIARYTSFDPDGYVGALVAVAIAVTGIKIMRRTASKLLGERLSKELIAEIKKRFDAYKDINGVHDLTVHNYVNKFYASAHIEMDASLTIAEAHEIADRIEQDFLKETDIILTLHIDPIFCDPKTTEMKALALAMVEKTSPDYSLHDFRMVKCGDESKMIFEVTVPYGVEDFPSVVRAITDNLYAEFGTRNERTPLIDITIEHEM